MKTTFARWVGAVVLTASIFLSTFAHAVDPNPFAHATTINVIAPATESAPKVGLGKTVFYPHQLLVDQPENLKLSFEISDANSTSQDLKRLNFLGLGIQFFILTDEDQYWNNSGVLKDYAIEGEVVYTNDHDSPVANSGMLVVPYDSEGNIIASLVGTRIKVPNPYVMNGMFEVHSDPSMKVHKVKIINMPFVVNAQVKEIIREAREFNPNVKMKLLVDCYAYIGYALNIQNGCSKILGFNDDNYCHVHIDGRLIPSEGLKLSVVDQTTIEVPSGCLSWLDLYETTTLDDATSWKKVDLKDCNFQMSSSRSSVPPPMDRLRISGLKNPEERKFFRLSTRIDP